ncbi:MAG: type IX secretion system membrane protein PorP/SprF [Flavobacteriales bacterium]|nr:type IX secretion system membrane protein PorP/SprF [Flavobacteriales bacterium]
MRKLTLIAYFLVVASSLFAQNFDLINNKELPELNKLNPAFTGVLNRLRFMYNQSATTDLGFETRLFKSSNHFGVYATFDGIDHIQRKSFNAQYARNIELKNNLNLKLAANVNYQIRLFHRGNEVNFSFKDFNGFEYHVDSLNIKDFSTQQEVFDLGIGTALLWKNLVLGFNVNHLNQPDINLQNSQSLKSKIEMNAQLMGFFKLGKLMAAPTAIYAQQGSDVFSSLGLNLTYKNLGITGQYEDLNSQTGYDFGLTYRYKKRHLLNISYRSNLTTTSNTKDGILTATVNSTLFKPKKELDGVLDKIKLVY